MAVNQAKRGRPLAEDSKLSHDLIIATAREWVFSETKTFSMRALANRLDVDPMAIYHYFRNKAALLEAVMIAIMQDIYVPIANNDDWQLELKMLCQSYLEQLSKHPGLLESLLSMGEARQVAAEIFTDRFNIAISPLMLDAETQKAALDLIADYLHGFALAMHCAKDGVKPTIHEMEKPLALYFRALEGVGS